jgi:hypothetical protein
MIKELLKEISIMNTCESENIVDFYGAFMDKREVFVRAASGVDEFFYLILPFRLLWSTARELTRCLKRSDEVRDLGALV